MKWRILNWLFFFAFRVQCWCDRVAIGRECREKTIKALGSSRATDYDEAIEALRARMRTILATGVTVGCDCMMIEMKQLMRHKADHAKQTGGCG